MFIKNKIFICALFTIVLGGCATIANRDWGKEYGEVPATGVPSDIAPSFYNLEYGEFENRPAHAPVMDGNVKQVSVLLPLTGPNAGLGAGIRNAVEIAFLQKQPAGVIVTFNDLSGDKAAKTEKIKSVLERNPDMIIGPIFSEDVEILRTLKSAGTPALTFTSSHSVLGGGVFTLALLPNQSVEAIIKSGGGAPDVTQLMILAPDTKAGHMLANTALEAAGFYNIGVSGLYYYKESDMNSQKSVAEKAALWNARQQAATRAKEILSDILTNHDMDASERDDIESQLELLSKSDTVGSLPFDAVLFLGNAGDSRSLASFMRYFDVPGATVRFLGTAMWDTEVMWGDVTFSGAEYSALPAISQDFVRVYSDLHGAMPNRMNSMGYDAAMLTIGALTGKRVPAAHLLDPAGYNGLDGLVRLRPNGTNERALQIMRLNASGAPRIKTPAARNFMTPLYKTEIPRAGRPREIEPSAAFDPMDYITLPAHLAGRHNARKSDAPETYDAAANPVIIITEEDSDAPVEIDPDFTPVKIDAVDRQMVDSVTVTQRQ
ncbi:MAG: penicillin-binding protein activator [Alphaproteobacteria bacterium]|nr:penicillin-binding protein activator [Alphaproteobacteria bacterium]